MHLWAGCIDLEVMVHGGCQMGQSEAGTKEIRQSQAQPGMG